MQHEKMDLGHSIEQIIYNGSQSNDRCHILSKLDHSISNTLRWQPATKLEIILWKSLWLVLCDRLGNLVVSGL